VLSPHDSESATPELTLCERETVSETARPPLTLSALPRLTAQPRVSALPFESAQPLVSAEPFVSAQPTVSALPLVSAHPTVSAVPQLSELVSALDPPWLSLWLVPPPALWLVELATPELWPVLLLTPTAMPDESAEACEEELALPAVLLKVTPVPCPVVSAAPLLSVCDAPALPEMTPGTPALIEPLRPSLTPELVVCAVEPELEYAWVSLSLWDCPVAALSVWPLLTDTLLPWLLDSPADTVCPEPCDQLLELPSATLQLVPSECATPVA
jgi:hypothetical protein